MEFGAHWSDKWLGTTFRPGEYDCLDFVQEVMATDFGRELKIPARHRGENVRIMARDIAALGGIAADPIQSSPVDGDGVLLKPRGTRIPGYHVGVVAIISGEIFVMHCVEVMGGVRFPAATIEDHGWTVEGYYRWL
ncbi:hypothetical protein F4212_09035 [Candidatus Poribacteria bacterium]|nr:hypothetical protein [Candidatus Poribacteria bacterium]